MAPVQPDPAKRTTVSSSPWTASRMMRPGVLAQAGRLQAGAAALGVGVRVAGQDLVADEVLEEGQRPAARRVVGVGDPAAAVRRLHHVVLADDGGPDELEEGLGPSRCVVAAVHAPQAPTVGVWCPLRRARRRLASETLRWGGRGFAGGRQVGSAGATLGSVHSIRMQATAVGLAIGGVLSLPALVVLALVTGDAGQTAAAWPAVAGPLLVLGAGLGLLAGGLRRPAVAPGTHRRRIPAARPPPEAFLRGGGIGRGATPPQYLQPARWPPCRGAGSR